MAKQHSVQALIAKERAMDHGPKTRAETSLEQRISKATGTPEKGKR